MVPETGVKTFFLDYQARATIPFKGFTRGKAEFDASRGVYAVELHSVGAPVELTAAEHAARTIAMQTATDNGENILQELTLEYNKGRQQKITSEILDIVGGSMQ